jgi:hypothetical protein
LYGWIGGEVCETDVESDHATAKREQVDRAHHAGARHAGFRPGQHHEPTSASILPSPSLRTHPQCLQRLLDLHRYGYATSTKIKTDSNALFLRKAP